MSKIIKSPIVLFVYNRPWHTQQTIDALKNNEFAKQSDLIIYSDAAKNEQAESKVQEVRNYIKNIKGFSSITIIEREKNLGLANSIIDGVTAVVNQYGSVIVIEDDLVTSPYFLKYMNEALERFAQDERVISIHGYVYPVKQSLPEAFFLPGADCWGWATWKRGWDIFNPDGEYLLQQLKEKNLIASFDYNGSSKYSKMLEDQIKGRNDSWAVRWYASAFLAGKLTLYPSRSLVHNIGNDNSGTHCDSNTLYNVRTSTTAINLSKVNAESYHLGRKIFENFFKQRKTNIFKKIHTKLKDIFAL
jgi:GT2 family glycosyltransferase